METSIIENWISIESILEMVQALAELCPDRDPLPRGQPIAGLERQLRDADEAVAFISTPTLSKLHPEWLRTPSR